MSSRCIHVVAGIRTPFLFKAERHSAVRMDHILFIQSSFNGHWGCFLLLTGELTPSSDQESPAWYQSSDTTYGESPGKPQRGQLGDLPSVTRPRSVRAGFRFCWDPLLGSFYNLDPDSVQNKSVIHSNFNEGIKPSGYRSSDLRDPNW